MDANLTDIADAARKLGFRVSIINNDLADICWQLGATTELVEVKNPHGRNRFTDNQKDMRRDGWIIRTVRSVDDVMLARNEITFGR